MAKSRRLKIVTRIGKPGEGKPVAGFFAGVMKDDEKRTLLKHLDRFCPVKIEDLIERREVVGNFKEFHILHLGADKPIDRIVLIGLGDSKGFDRDTVRSTSAKAARTLRKVRCASMAVDARGFGNLPPGEAAEAVVEGAILGLYRHARYQKSPGKKSDESHITEIVFFCKDKKDQAAVKAGAKRGEALAEATNEARILAHSPANRMRPQDLVAHARALARKHKKVTLKVYRQKDLEKMGAGGILAVGQGSTEESFLIDLQYKGAPRGGLKVATVGKGVTFDTGGISIKPSGGMHMMKYDMSGSAAVLGAFDAVATLGLPIDLNCVVPTAENMPDGYAYKPGDVIQMLSGHYVEVLNTDAEGRLLLADGLWHASQKKPDFMIDVATLTGAIIIALGHTASGVYSNTPVLPGMVIEAGAAYNEKYWHMPLFDEYKVHISSLAADQTNDGGRPGSANSAAKFLQPFANDLPWAHLDIAGTAWIEESSILYVHKPYLPKRGATGFGVRTVASLLSRLAGMNKKEIADLRKKLAERS